MYVIDNLQKANINITEKREERVSSNGKYDEVTNTPLWIFVISLLC